MKLAVRVALPMVVFVACGTSTAADIAADLRTCAAHAVDSVRLACYDKLAARRSDTPAESKAEINSPGKQNGVTRPETKSQGVVVDNPEKNFGLRAEQIDKANGTQRLSRIKSKVARIETRQFGRMIITLENGQVWEQKTADSLFYLNVGDEVTIKEGVLGAHILTAPSNRFTNVGRVR